MVEATFKVRPLPEQEVFVVLPCAGFEMASERIRDILASDLNPVVLDLHNLGGTDLRSSLALVVGFDGSREEVEWQRSRISALADVAPANLDYDQRLRGHDTADLLHRHSVLPSQIVEVISTLGCGPFVARVGNGVVYYRGGPPPPKTPVPAALTQRVKDIFDPNGVFPELSL